MTSFKSAVKAVPVFAVKVFEVVEVYLHIFLSSALDGVSGQLYAVCPVKKPMVLTEYEDL
jgi:hypothetical protein